MSDQELADTIEKEAAQHIPFDLADVNLDYQILSDDATSPQMDVLLVAVKKDNQPAEEAAGDHEGFPLRHSTHGTCKEAPLGARREIWSENNKQDDG